MERCGSMMKSDVDCVNISSYDDDTAGHVTRVSGYFTSATTPTRAESDSFNVNMVPCKQKSNEQTSPNSYVNLKESDSNGNDIRKVNNCLTTSHCHIDSSFSSEYCHNVN